MDNNTQNYVDYNEHQPATKNGLAIAGFVIACVSVFFDPCLILSIIGFIFGIVGMNNSTDKTYRGLGLAAIIISIATLVIQSLVDLIITISTFGTGFFTIFF